MKNTFLKKILIIGIILLFLGTSVIPGILGDIEKEKDIIQVNEPRFAPSSTADCWSMFGHDLNHSHSSTSLGPDTNKSLWNYTTGGMAYSSPAVANGKVYIGSADGKVYCLEAATGGFIWSYTTGWYVWSSPAVASGKVYIGSEDYKVYCLDSTTGGLIWSHGTGSYVDSSPVVASGKVYIGSTDGTVYCLNATTGSNIWSYTTGSYVFSSPAVASGNVYIGSYDHKVYCLNASTGVKLWSYATGGSVYSSPAVADGKVYVGSLNDCTVYCLDATTGGPIWNYSTGYTVTSSPAVANGNVYIGSSDGTLYCLNATTGGLVWSYTTGGQVMYSSPAVANGKVYLGSEDNKIYCLDAATGGLIWSYTTGYWVTSSPAVYDGKVYVGSDDHNVYAFGSPQNLPPVLGTPNPANGSTGQPTSLSWSIPINDPEGDLFSWSIQCSNGQSSNGAGASNGTKTQALSGLAYSTTYTVWVNATDPGGSGLDTRRWYTFTTRGYELPSPPRITGPAKGKVGAPTYYNFTEINPEGDLVYYFIDWGDNTNSSWIGPYQPGVEISKSHTWSNRGSYTIKAKVKNVYGWESDWGTLQVTMPMSYEPPQFRFFEWLFERFPHAFPILKQLLGH
jgi:outer membrane protein assembly factor BamB